jgi:hypothetical protein
MKKLKKKPNLEFYYKLTDLDTGKVKVLGTIIDISRQTGLGAGYLSTRIKPYAGAGTVEFKNYRVEYRLREKGDIIEQPIKAKKIDLITSTGYSILIKQYGDIHYYITTEKQLQKSRIRKTYNSTTTMKMQQNPNKQYKGSYGVEHLEITEQDLEMFDLEKEYQEKIVNWRNKPMFLDDIELVNQLIDDILIIKKRKKNIKQFGRESIR